MGVANKSMSFGRPPSLPQLQGINLDAYRGKALEEVRVGVQV